MCNLVGRFGEAGLSVEVAASPVVRTLIGSGSTDIVQLTIRKAVRNGEGPREKFSVFRGHSKNRVEVLGIDRTLRQLVLFVQEPSREFEQRVWSAGGSDRGGSWILQKSKTTASKRHFLMGMDETHLFIAQLPRPATTVRAAQETLKANEVDVAATRSVAVVRQGEWFFLAPSAGELEALEEALKKTRVAVQRRAPIGPVFDGTAQAGRVTMMRGHARVRQGKGNPHVADEVVAVVVTDATSGQDRRVFARGAVRHVEHRTVVLKGWMRVVRNAEPASTAPARGVGWVD